MKSVRVCPLRNRKPEPTKTRFREAIFEGPTVRYPESLLHRELYYSSDKVGTLPQTLPLSASSSRCQTVYLSHDVRRSLSLSLSRERGVAASRSRKVRGLTDVWPTFSLSLPLRPHLLRLYRACPSEACRFPPIDAHRIIRPTLSMRTCNIHVSPNPRPDPPLSPRG